MISASLAQGRRPAHERGALVCALRFALHRRRMPLSPPLLDAFHARTPIRAGSLIVTIFGDAVAPRGGELSLASLVEIMAAFRIGAGVVRTALSRLVAEGWFE